MQYCYETTSEFSAPLILGSVVRALGKGWKIGLQCSDEHKVLFKKFRELLQNKAQFQIIENEIENSHQFQLLIREFPEVPTFTSANHCIDIVKNAEASFYDLVSKVEFSSLDGINISAITGNGKGKTTLALGLAAQNILSQRKSIIVQWFKEKKSGDLTWAINEHFFPNLLRKRELMTFYPMGLGFFGSPTMDRVKGEKAYQQHKDKAYEGLELARNLISSGEYSCIVLDELVDTVKEIAQNIEYPLIDLKDVQDFLHWCTQQPIQMVVTGRRVTNAWENFINTSIVIKEVKHPWSTSKIGAISGLDF